MAMLQRSATTFRRSGSSGLVWDQRFFSGELAKPNNREVGPAAELSEPLRHVRGITGGIAHIRTPTTAANGGGGRGLPDAAAEPPSPKVPVCLCCGFNTGKHDRDNRAKRRA